MFKLSFRLFGFINLSLFLAALISRLTVVSREAKKKQPYATNE